MNKKVCRKCRRAGVKLFLKGEKCMSAKCPITTRNYVPGEHGPRSKVRLSEYGRQLREKQKAQNIYNISATQLKNYFQLASKRSDATNEVLMQLLELRLDNIVYRLGLSESRRQARNYIKDGHILVNERRTTVPGREIKIKDIIKIKKTDTGISKRIDEKKDKIKTFDWLKLDKKTYSGQIVKIPTRDEIETDVDEALVIEFYSR